MYFQLHPAYRHLRQEMLDYAEQNLFSHSKNDGRKYLEVFVMITTRNLSRWYMRAVTGRMLQMLEGHKAEVLRVAINSTGTLIASISWDGTICLWGVSK